MPIYDETFQTEQTCAGLAAHPVTGETVFFNQAHLFYVSSLGDEVAEMLLEDFGPRGVPRNATFGDGGPFQPDELEAVRKAFARHVQAVTWQAGDVLLLDNMRVAHGRNPYSGPRVLLASLLDAFAPLHTTQAEGSLAEG